MMLIENQTKRVICVTDPHSNSIEFISDLDPDFADVAWYDTTTDLVSAQDWSNFGEHDQMKAVVGLQRYLDAEATTECRHSDICEMVNVSLSLHKVAFDKDTWGELCRHEALKKLNQRDIEALGLTEIAIYDKLKFHNVEETEHDG